MAPPVDTWRTREREKERERLGSSLTLPELRYPDCSAAFTAERRKRVGVGNDIITVFACACPSVIQLELVQ